jgi:hypothetical protein
VKGSPRRDRPPGTIAGCDLDGPHGVRRAD